MAAVVVMDGEQVVLDVVAKILRRGGHTVQAFADPAPALEQVDFGNVDLVIADVADSAPAGDAVRILRERGISVPVIGTSAQFDGPDIDGLRGLGVTKLLRKPFGIGQLEEVSRILTWMSGAVRRPN